MRHVLVLALRYLRFNKIKTKRNVKRAKMRVLRAEIAARKLKLTV